MIAALLAEGTWTIGCGAGGASLPPPPPPVIEVTVNPANGSVVLGGQATFMATVTNTTDTAVSWSVNGAPGGNAPLGTITSDGVFTAPADMPSSETVQVTATSHADSTKSGTTTLAITSDITLALRPNPASVELGATQAFQASNEQRASGYLETLEPFGPGVRQRVRDSDQEVGQTAQSWGVSQPPPKRRPGPSEARKMGRRSWRACFAALPVLQADDAKGRAHARSFGDEQFGHEATPPDLRRGFAGFWRDKMR